MKAILTAFVLLLGAAAFSGPAQPTLLWDPVPEAAGYKVHVGTSPRAYTASFDVGASTSFQITNATPGARYYMAVTAYETNRVESDFSDEISFAILNKPGRPRIVP